MSQALWNPINWSFLARAHEFYPSKGWAPIEVPWVVAPYITRSTMPPGIQATTTGMGDLIGSGEQGLLHLAVHHNLASGKWMTCTPCFRDDVSDDLHGKHFVKVELMWLDPVSVMNAWLDILDDARNLFQELGLPSKLSTQSDHIDLVSQQGIELGSYGVRSAFGRTWVYGTGLAEPRFSTALKIFRESVQG